MSNPLTLEDLPESLQLIAANALSRAIEGQWDEDNRALAANIAGAFISLYEPAESCVTVRFPSGTTKQELEAAIENFRSDMELRVGVTQ